MSEYVGPIESGLWTTRVAHRIYLIAGDTGGRWPAQTLWATFCVTSCFVAGHDYHRNTVFVERPEKAELSGEARLLYKTVQAMKAQSLFRRGISQKRSSVFFCLLIRSAPF